MLIDSADERRCTKTLLRLSLAAFSKGFNYVAHGCWGIFTFFLIHINKGKCKTFRKETLLM